MGLRGLVLALAVLCAGGAQAQEIPNGAVLAALNAARADPGAYARSLGGFRRFFHQGFYLVPGHGEHMATSEGVAAVNDAILFLGRQAGVGLVAGGALLAAAAGDLAAEQRRSGAVGHGGDDGTGPGDRVRRRGGGEQVAEMIAYGAVDAADVIRQLVVDDGVPARDHRAILFDPRLRYAGVACGAHPMFRTMCVIDLAGTPDGSADDVPLRTGAIHYGH